MLSLDGLVFIRFIAFFLPILVSLHTVEKFEYHRYVQIYPSYLISLQDDTEGQVKPLEVLMVLVIHFISLSLGT